MSTDKRPEAFVPLYSQERGDKLPLPASLAALLGDFRLPLKTQPPYVIGNFVSTIDGVVSLNEQGHTGGGPISGFLASDHVLMGVLRAAADAIIVGAGTLRDEPGHRWTAEYIYPAFAQEYRDLRLALGKTTPPLTVLVSASGHIDLNQGLFQRGEVPVLIITTPQGEKRVRTKKIPSWVQLASVQPQQGGNIRAQNILTLVEQACHGQLFLTEGGPQLLNVFLSEGQLDELFLTLAPQLAGHIHNDQRPAVVMGAHFAPERPLWSTLQSVRLVGSHLFLRYAFRERE
ncbi:hypothetical protein KSD_18090 [Ktedonobacter sp. SOSP1-85]|uniref:dihydrofolate reductase family protein n=1 Tax=Ktedonobacter sp. SOSP1-85 TaxID=2778367 RepID=UPI0019161769|nr:dihydrofolate reductase family protein [Ktedonobacter sp. SOSP1-85]GHO74038.1 hypothetical protein KSD_18090 [Ktedonobacter sp. SOSP1-85]